jgi:hypothetical protein
LVGNKTTLAKSLGVTAVTIILGVSTQTGPDRVQVDVGSHGGQCLTLPLGFAFILQGIV